VDGRTLRSEELAGDVEGFAADDDDFLAVEELFGDGAGEAAEEVAFAVYHNLGDVLVWMCSCCHLFRIQLIGMDAGCVEHTTGSKLDILTSRWRCQGNVERVMSLSRSLARLQ
jgi:hypothetical protein